MPGKFTIGHLVYELTEACNQNCRFCYNHWRPEGCAPPDAALAARTLRLLLKQANIGSVSFSGGEPTLLGNIHDLALRCRFKGTAVNILTNGTRISEDDINIYKDIGISAVQIPLLSSDSVVHDYLTALPGSWEKACTSIRRVLSTLGPEHLAAVLILTAKNTGDVAGTLAHYRSMGIRTVMVNRFNLGGNGLKNRDELIITGKTLNRAFRIISDFSISAPEMHFVSGVCTPVCVLDPFEFPGIRFTSCSTDIRNRPVTVSFRGDVRFCNHSPFILGNIWEQNIGDILTDETLVGRYSEMPSECAGCKLYSRCRGGCRAASEQVHGTFRRVDPIRGILNGTRL